MRLTTRTSLALRTLMFCAVNQGVLVRKHEVAQAINASEHHLAQVVNRLGQLDFLMTLRGRRGGFRLARPAAQIGIGAVYRAFEASVPIAECFDIQGGNTCPISHACRMRGHLVRAVEAFYATLDPLTLDDLVSCNGGLQTMLALPDARPATPLNCAGHLAMAQ
ncbi:RrF2 family transcriptional regulator [Roseicitreum antarcticum]|uniref:Transcriptional regulator, BadM/Rrf2 family n=1 Tax=Roseicitreum antarcticum TaxID=564137 RepID=A0A1H3A278_9RHOB|nr:Rrf2 family transcriptional regulator [Roseicitreum antarcticum]SDX23019.1 transcriptional regulator, BadM/Rrf2 family [Roseicitreum antarcticum]